MAETPSMVGGALAADSPGLPECSKKLRSLIDTMPGHVAI